MINELARTKDYSFKAVSNEAEVKSDIVRQKEAWEL